MRLNEERKRVEHLILGIDLAGAQSRPTGVCLLEGWQAKTFLLYSDEGILECAVKKKPDLVAIDAPLNLPPGRKTIEERKKCHFRPCDLELRKRKIPFFPITLGPMRALTERGIKLRTAFERRGFRVIEVYPGGAQDVWGIPRAKHNLSGLRQGLMRLGIRGLTKKATADELDAATAAMVGLLFLQGRAEIYGNFSHGSIVMPFSSKSQFCRK